MAPDDQPSEPVRQPHRGSNPLTRACFFWLGVMLVIVSPLVGAIPGPGGIFVFAAGAGLMLRNSRWTKKLYARFKRSHPKKGAWADWSLRRRSHLRRTERDKARAAAAAEVTTARVVLGKHGKP